MAVARGWTELEIRRHEAVFDGLVARGVRTSLRALTADLRPLLTAANWPQLTFGQTGTVAATWNAYVDQSLFPYLVQVFVDAGEAAGEAVQAATDVTLPSVGTSYAAQYLASAPGRLFSLGDLVWDQVRQQLALGYDSGESISQLATRIRDVADVTEKRALAIARTEVASAANQGSLYQMLIAGFTDQECQKGWLATEDERTRPAHVQADGQWVGILQPFLVGGEGLQCPGDPTGRPDNIINCRCTLEFRFHDDVLTAGFSHTFKRWISALHPRNDDDGRFVKRSGGGGSAYPKFQAPTFTPPKKHVVAPRWQPSTPKPGAPDFHMLEEHERGRSGDYPYAPGMYGRFGAAGVMIRANDAHGVERFLVVRRQGGKAHGKWQLPGGALDQFETPEQGAARETFEELGTTAAQLAKLRRRGVHRVSQHVPGKDPWTYHNITADAPSIFPLRNVDPHELSGAAWLTKQQLRTMRQHGLLLAPFAQHLESVFATFDARPTTASAGEVQFRWVESEHPRDPIGEFTDKFDWLTSDDAWDMHDKMTAYEPWTQRHEEVLQDYAGSGYAAVNMYLRDGDKYGEPDPITLEKIADIHDAMRPTTRAVKVQRSLYADAFEGAKISDDLEKMIGKTFEEPGFLSTTTDPNFLYTTGQRNSRIVRLELDVPAGTPAAFLGFPNGPGIEQESELLLDHGTRFVITGVEERPHVDPADSTKTRMQFIVRGRVVPRERAD